MPQNNFFSFILSLRINTILLISVLIFVPISPVLSAQSFPISDTEQNYLKSREPITMCVDPDWLPYEKIDINGKHIGIGAEYIKLFSNMIGKEVKLIPTNTWAQSEEYAASRKCDILSMLNKSEKRSKYLNFTSPFIKASVVLIAKDDVPFIDGMKGLVGKSIGIVKGYVYEEMIRDSYPDIKIVYVKSMDEAFRLVSDGKLFSTMGSLYIVTNRILELGLSNLKIAGSTMYSNDFRVGVRNDDPLLLQLFEKSVKNISPQAESKILEKWITIRIEHGTDYKLLFKIVGGGLFIILLLGYQHLRVKKVVVQLNKSNKLLEEKSSELLFLSHTDALTKINNRLYMDKILVAESDRYLRYKIMYSCILLDIDKFKNINDSFGHNIGDEVLKKLAKTLKHNIRKNDVVGRWGGEEFLIICPNTDCTGATTLAELLRKEIEETKFEVINRLTCSFGVAEVKEEENNSQLIFNADKAMYQAKNGGRNKVMHTC